MACILGACQKTLARPQYGRREVNPEEEFQDDVQQQLPEEKRDEELIKFAEKYLTAFDLSLATKLKPYVQQLEEKGKQQFLKDVAELNDAIEDEILVEMLEKLKDNSWESLEGLASLYGKISKDVVDKVVARYQDKPWLTRIMSFAGNEIESSANN